MSRVKNINLLAIHAAIVVEKSERVSVTILGSDWVSVQAFHLWEPLFKHDEVLNMKKDA